MRVVRFFSTLRVPYFTSWKIWSIIKKSSLRNGTRFVVGF